METRLVMKYRLTHWTIYLFFVNSIIDGLTRFEMAKRILGIFYSFHNTCLLENFFTSKCVSSAENTKNTQKPFYFGKLQHKSTDSLHKIYRLQNIVPNLCPSLLMPATIT